MSGAKAGDATKGLCSDSDGLCRRTWTGQAPRAERLSTIAVPCRDLDHRANLGTFASAMQTFRYPHFPQELSAVHVALFTNVINSADIRSRIIRASQLQGPDGQTERDAVKFAFIDARLVRTTIRNLLITPYIHVHSRSVASCISKPPSTRPSSHKLRPRYAQKPCTQKSSGPSTPQTMCALF